MLFAKAIALGLRRARRHLGLAFILYLATLVPALLVVSLAASALQPALDPSPFAGALLTGNGIGVFGDYARSAADHLGPIRAALPARFLLVTLLEVLVAAGTVEVLLEREHRRTYPFLQGIGAHGWSFVRSALGFLLPLATLAVAVGLLAASASALAQEQGDGRIELAGWALAAVVAGLAFAPLDLAYDLSRVAAAAHGDRRTFLGFWRSLGHVLTHPRILAPLYLSFALILVGLQAAYLAVRPAVAVTTWGGIVLLAVAQQAVFLLRAFFRTAFWGAEIAYYQGIGEPRWCAGRARAAAQTPRHISTSPQAPPPATAPSTAPATTSRQV